MNSPSCEEAVSVASNDAFKDYEASYYHNGMDQSPLGCLEELPRLIGEELLPRLDRGIQLLETQSDCPSREHLDGHVPEQPKRKSLRKVTRAARRRIKDTKAKASAIFFQNHGRIVVPKATSSTREEFNVAKRRLPTRHFSTCWPEPQTPYDNVGSYSTYSAIYNPKNQSSW